MTLLETFPSHSRDVISSARISPRGVRSANQSRAVGNESFNFVGMDASMVVATGSRCCPSDSFSVSSMKSQGVFCLDLSHIAPAQEDLGEWIDDQHSFIADFQSGLVNDQVNETSNSERCDNGEYDVEQVCCYEGLKQGAEQEGVADARENERRFGAESLNVGHRELSFMSGDSNV